MSPQKLARNPLKGIPQNPLLEVPKWFTEIPPKTLLTVLDFGTIFDSNFNISHIYEGNRRVAGQPFPAPDKTVIVKGNQVRCYWYCKTIIKEIKRRALYKKLHSEIKIPEEILKLGDDALLSTNQFLEFFKLTYAALNIRVRLNKFPKPDSKFNSTGQRRNKWKVSTILKEADRLNSGAKKGNLTIEFIDLPGS